MSPKTEKKFTSKIKKFQGGSPSLRKKVGDDSKFVNLATFGHTITSLNDGKTTVLFGGQTIRGGQILM